MNQDAARAVNLTNAIDLVINVSPCSIDEPTNISPGAKFTKHFDIVVNICPNNQEHERTRNVHFNGVYTVHITSYIGNISLYYTL